jgi:predicted nucleotidyltransferase
MIAQLHVPHSLLAEFCQRHHIQRLALFGSVLRQDFNADSDVDVWVEFEPGHTPGLAFFSMEAELSEILDRRVDLNTPAWLGPHFRERVARQLEVLYDTAQSPGQQAPSAP